MACDLREGFIVLSKGKYRDLCSPMLPTSWLMLEMVDRSPCESKYPSLHSKQHTLN